jgi:hypothetical protein
MNRIIIHVSGGMVVGVRSDSKEEFDVEIWDEDIMENGGFLTREEAEAAEENDTRLSLEYQKLRPIY